MSWTAILDTSSFMHRAYHASKDRPYYTKAGQPIAAISLFQKMLARLQRENDIDFLVAACDTREPTFRTALYPEYKAGRATPEPEFLQQKPGMLDVLATMCIPTFEAVGYEADDVIGTLAELLAGEDVLIVSGDKDMCQLVRPGVSVLNTNKGEVWDAAAVKLNFGVGPEQIADYLALVGDVADNVPGAPGIGPTGALEILRQFPTVEEAIAKSGRIVSGAYRHAVQTHADQIMLSKRLVTICRDVPLPEAILV